MSRPRKIINEETTEMESKTRIYARNIRRRLVASGSDAVPASVVEEDLDALKNQGYKITSSNLVDSNVDELTMIFVLERE